VPRAAALRAVLQGAGDFRDGRFGPLPAAAERVRSVPPNGRVLVVIPAWNEAANLPEVVGELRRIRTDDDLLVVDDGSSDSTASVARALGCRVVRFRIHLGYGAAIQAGIKFGLRQGYGLVVTFDGDGQHDPADLAVLAEAVRGGADLVLGSRVLAPGAHRGGLVRRSGRLLFAGLARVIAGLRLTDPTSGLKALGPQGQRLFALARFPDRFPDADALVLASRARLRVEERPARMRRSRNRHSMHGGLRGVAYTFNMLFSLFVAALGRESDLRG
jgi:glycosyltransferase involved in cell wall biosynthesis